MKGSRRIIAVILAIAVALAVSAAFMFVAMEADHDCCGHDCPVCAVIAFIGRVVRALAVSAVTVLICGISLHLTLRVKCIVSDSKGETPVTMKTRLLN